MKKLIVILIIFLTILNFGCDEEFDIVENYKEQIVVFMALDNRTDKQFIKVQKLQNEVGLPSGSKLLTNLSVKLVDTYGIARFFKDTILSGVDNFNVLYLDSLELKEGSYSLFVNSNDKIYSWSNAVVRGPQQLYVSSDKEYYKVTIAKSASTRGFLVRTFLPYKRTIGSAVVEERIEVPAEFYISGKDTTEIYPSVQKSDITETATSSITYVRFDAITYIKSKLMHKYGIANQDFGKLIFYAFSYDWNLFEYINSYSGFHDEFSVRLDKPNYTNIVWGNGVFGSIRVDSVELK